MRLTCSSAKLLVCLTLKWAVWFYEFSKCQSQKIFKCYTVFIYSFLFLPPQIFIRNIGKSTATILNDKQVPNSLVALSHGDIITIVDRKFRFEFSTASHFYPGKSPAKSPKTPGSSKSPMVWNWTLL